MLLDDLVLIYNSIRGAVFSTIIASIIALPVSYILVFKNFRAKFIIEFFTILPLGLPPVITGYVLLIIFSPNYFLGSIIYNLTGSTIAFTWVAGSIAASIVSFPLIIRSFQLGFSNVDQIIIDSAESLGMSKQLIFTKVILPISKKGIYAGLLICFARSISEFGATIVVAGNMPGETQNLSTAIYSSISSLNTNEVIRLSSYSVLLAILSISLHNYLLGRLK
tara:strand:+ start:3339 stop:4004 length:666 start_codon:yes stop_codon:yes gene_type:complete